MSDEHHIASVHVENGDTPYATRVRAGSHQLAADEPAAVGGGNTGPAPYALLLSSLGACTSITLRMYAARKGWQLEPMCVELHFFRGEDAERIERTIQLGPAVTPEQRVRLAEIADKTPVTPEQRVRLAEIADKTPVTRTLSRATEIKTTVV